MQSHPMNDDKADPAKAEPQEKGAEVIRSRLPGLPTSPGVYRMLNEAGDVLYVGKAKNIRKRVTSYASPERQSIRIRRMIALTVDLEIVKTETEAEALTHTLTCTHTHVRSFARTWSSYKTMKSLKCKV